MANEKSVRTFTIRPLDESGSAFTPTNARYRLDDKTSQNSIVAWTVIATPSTEMEIKVIAEDNAIIDTSLPEEVKVLTVETDYATDDAHVEEHEYTVRNLQFVS